MVIDKVNIQDNPYGPCVSSSTSVAMPNREQNFDEEPGRYFPRQLAIGLGMAKILMAILLFIFGSIAIVVDASLALLGGGMWSGMVVLVTGIFAIIAAKRPSSYVHVVSFLCLSILSIAATGMVIVFSATGLVNDLNIPNSYYVDSDGQRLASFGEVNLKGPAIILNAILIVIGTLDCLISISCCIITLREACKCNYLYHDTTDLSDSQTRKERLINWLGQQALLESNTIASDACNSMARVVWHVSPKTEGNRYLLDRSLSSSSNGSIPSRIAAYDVSTIQRTTENTKRGGKL